MRVRLLRHCCKSTRSGIRSARTRDSKSCARRRADRERKEFLSLNFSDQRQRQLPRKSWPIPYGDLRFNPCRDSLRGDPHVEKMVAKLARLMKGSRLRLVVSSVNSILRQKNYCSGGVIADGTTKDARICNIQVYHDAQHASAIQFPLR